MQKSTVKYFTVEGFNAYKQWLADIKQDCNDVNICDRIPSIAHTGFHKNDYKDKLKK